MAVRRYTHVFVKTRFIGFHRWLDAPKEFEFLRHFHRHEFHVQLTVKVEELNRQIEFLKLKDELDAAIAFHFTKVDRWRYFEDSCEQIADKLCKQFQERLQIQSISCEVSEDGENGAIVNYVETPW
jgi:hypothetical protein